MEIPQSRHTMVLRVLQVVRHIPRVLRWCAASLGAAGVVLWVLQVSPPIGLGILAILTILGILAHNPLHRLIEGRPVPMYSQESPRPFLHAPEAVLPPVSFLTALSIGWLDFQQFLGILPSRLNILAIIFALASVALFLSRTGFFQWAANSLLQMQRSPLLALFLGSSLLVCFSSNDAIVLGMTPVVLALFAGQNKMRDAKPLLLTQFFAANTLSMATFVGSPTNIIVAERLGLSFIKYMELMLFPAALALAGSLLAIGVLFRKYLGRESRLSAPPTAREKFPPSGSRQWIVLLITLLGLIACASLTPIPYAVAVLPILAYTGFRMSKNEWKRLPWPIVPFALTFFAFAYEVSFHFPYEQIVSALDRQDHWLITTGSLVGTSLLLNLLNDLPTAALLAEIAAQVGDLSSVRGQLFLQALLAGLNLGCCLTPVGALAGLMWLHQIRQFGHENVSLPTGGDLIRYGIGYFLIVSTVLVSGLMVRAWTMIALAQG